MEQSHMISTDKQQGPIRVIGLCGSLRSISTTRQALSTALNGAAEIGAETQLVDLRNYELVFCDGKDKEDEYPEDVFKLRREIQQAQGLILGTPEYHGGYSGVLKNALDLMGFSEFQGKVIGLVGVAGGQTGAINALNGLRTVGRSLRAWVIPNQVSIAQAWQVFDDAGRIKDKDLENRLLELGREVARFAYLHTSEQALQFLESWETAKQNPGGE
jgi:NAD(P)H-dependent FMN reductase